MNRNKLSIVLSLAVLAGFYNIHASEMDQRLKYSSSAAGNAFRARIRHEEQQQKNQEALQMQQAKYFGIPHKATQLASGTKSVFIGEKGRTKQIAAVGTTVVIATALAYVVAKKLGFLLTNKEQLAKLEAKLAQTIKAKETVKVDSAKAKVLDAKISTIKKDIAILKA